jgi:hypothetical protein
MSLKYQGFSENLFLSFFTKKQLQQKSSYAILTFQDTMNAK